MRVGRPMAASPSSVMRACDPSRLGRASAASPENFSRKARIPFDSGFWLGDCFGDASGLLSFASCGVSSTGFGS